MYTAISIATDQQSSTSVTTASECPVTKMKFDTHTCKLCVISGFRCEADKNSSLLGYSLPTFRDNLSDQNRDKRLGFETTYQPSQCPEMSVRNYCYSMLDNSEEHSSQNAHLSNSCLYTITSHMFRLLRWPSSETSYKG